jgi:hypothetical protein
LKLSGDSRNARFARFYELARSLTLALGRTTHLVLHHFMRISDLVARDMALSDACEDYTGLYELVWEFNTRFPDAPEQERLRAAQAALGTLVRDSFVLVYCTRWLSDQYRELKRADAEAVIANAESWRSPADHPDGEYFCFASSDEGEAHYFKRDGADNS